MTANGTVSIIWAGGEHSFCLAKTGLILDLESKCEAGIAVVFTRLGSGTWKLHDVREPIRLGLIGAGMEPKDAMELVRNHVDLNNSGLAPSVLIAYSVIEAVMVGVRDDPVGRQKGDDKESGEGKETPAEAPQTGSSMMTDASDALN